MEVEKPPPLFLIIVYGSVSRNFIISHPQQNVKSQVAQKMTNLIACICVILPVDFWCGLWYTIIVKGRGKSGVSGKDFGLTQECSAETPPPTLKKNVQNPLTNSTRCVIIALSGGELPVARRQ